MEDALVQRISQLRDLGTKSQRVVENRVEHELGIDLKRDAAGFALDFFLKDKNNIELLHQSLATYWKFAIFFIQIELDKVSTKLQFVTSRYQPYHEYISKPVPVFKSIIENCNGVGDKLLALKVLENATLNTKDDVQSRKKIASLLQIAKFKDQLVSCEALFNENEVKIKRAARGAKWLAFQKQLMKPMVWLVFPTIVVLIGTYLVRRLGLNG